MGPNREGKAYPEAKSSNQTVSLEKWVGLQNLHALTRFHA